MLYLYTCVFERKEQTNCAEMFFALSNVYRDAKPLQQTTEEVSKLRGILDLDPASQDYISNTKDYLGYKLLWCLNLFLQGKKYPSGNIKEAFWKQYVLDIVEFITNSQILKLLLDINPH
jgi:hypothetical protein